MRTSIIIAAHNEGRLLVRTVRSCVETCRELDHEIIVADDSSTDRSIRDLQESFPQVRIVRHSFDESEQPESFSNRGGAGFFRVE